MRVLLLEPASKEFQDARRYYDSQQAGLGNRLAREVSIASARICQWPRAFPFQHGEVRKCLLEHFPYKLLYALRDDRVLVVPVAHLHRDPDYWLDRLDLL
jgi:hypothetical protein